jgi:hypothetical protein
VKVRIYRSIARPGASPSLSALLEAVTRNGLNGQLPAHLSLVLGLGKTGETTAVNQIVIRDGHTVRAFNVCTADRDELA